MNWTRDTEHLRKAYLIPMTLQSRVCMCAEPGKTVTDPLAIYNTRVMNYCDKCFMPYRWYVRHCCNCGEWYIKDFRRIQRDCVRHPLCWDCTQNREPCSCMKENTVRQDFGPLGLNPKRYTKEELKGTFSFDSPF